MTTNTNSSNADTTMGVYKGQRVGSLSVDEASGKVPPSPLHHTSTEGGPYFDCNIAIPALSQRNTHTHTLTHTHTHTWARFVLMNEWSVTYGRALC